ncbi:DNA-binding CsgD family transcriptional regulator [Kitasatospora sp. GAS204A]|uniref:LuxR family transcriptional regulator n=1 Tax=unclassified Kitasatospora TaxID=2633591 RepID=UPI00247302D0|nr:LuxR family transcriptional regulator [Kitasatospora sp. GAS204B]MDH6118810.1 DNA-binding CsgD family transcriptional regulator [Kitasatospora sp. GAS204B]
MPRAAARIEASRRPAVRRAELRSVQSALERLRHGDGGIIEISGDPGSGKTRLLAEAKRAAEELGLATLSGCCAEAEEQTPLSAFAPIVGSRLMAEAMRDPAALPIGPFPLAATAAPQPARPRPNAIPEPFDTRLRARLLLARCARDGLVLLLDDFHWADACSVDVVEHFIRSPLDAPLLLILAHRPRQSAPRMRAALAHGIEMGTVEHLRLGPLTLHQSAEILDLPADHPQLHRLHRVSTGNPFYLLALADHRTCAAPPTDGASGPPACSPAPAPGDCAARLTADQTPLIIGELASLGAGEIAVLSAGAVLGDGFDWATLSTVADLPLDETARAIDRLAGKDLLQHSSCGSRLTLRHPALGTLLREDMTSSWRAGAHRRALRLLVRRGAPAAELADHLEFLLDTIGLDDLDVLERAARDALWSAPNLSIRWAKAALRILREPTDPDRHYLRLTQTLGYALAFSGQLTESSHLFRKIRPLLRTVPARVRLPTVALHAMVESLLDHRAEATTLLAEELAALPPRPPVEAVGLHVVQGLVGLLAGRAPEPAQVQAAVRIAAQHHDWLAEGGTLALRGLAEAMAGEVEVAGQSLSCSAALLDGFSDQRLRDHPEYLALLGRAELFIGRFKAARRHFERGVVLLRSPGHQYLLPVMLIGLASSCLRTGPLEQVRKAVDEAQEISLRIGANRLYGSTLALRSIERGWAGPDGSRAALRIAEQAVKAAPPNSDRWGLESALVLARAARLDGDPQRCVSTLLDAFGGPELPELLAVLRPSCFELLAAAAVESGQNANQWAVAARAAAAALPGPSWASYALAAQAHGARGSGHLPCAAQLYQEAAGGFGQAELIGDQARMLALGAACLAAAGQAGQADSLTAAADRSALRYGTKAIVVAAAVVEQPARPPQRPPAAPPEQPPRELLSPLTKREREVAGLASTAIRTRDIAKALGLSPKTVDVHLTRIYRKLNVNSRLELVRRMGELE